MGQAVQAEPEGDGVRVRVGARGAAGGDAGLHAGDEHGEGVLAERGDLVAADGRAVDGLGGAEWDAQPLATWGWVYPP
jgi:hypothetical protein